MKCRQFTLPILVALFASVTAQAAPNGAALSILVQEAEQKGELPLPILELMVQDGAQLEEATRVTVSTSASGTYAQGFTYHAICMSISSEQAQRVHDIAINSASGKYKTGVEAEARYSLTQFKENGCASSEDPSKDVAAKEPVPEATSEVVVDENVVVLEEDVLEIEERVVTLEPIADTAITGTVAGGASASL